MQAVYRDGSFLAQCQATFGEIDGNTVWEAVNSYFDTLPLAATIDDAVFCVHGGIPRELCEPGASLDLIHQVLPHQARSHCTVRNRTSTEFRERTRRAPRLRMTEQTPIASIRTLIQIY